MDSASSAAASSPARIAAAASTAARPAVAPSMEQMQPRSAPSSSSVVDLTSDSATSPTHTHADATAAPVKYFAFHTRRKKAPPRPPRRPRKQQARSSDEDEADAYSESEGGKRKRASHSSSSSSDSDSEAQSSSSSSSSNSSDDDDDELMAPASKASKPRKHSVVPRAGAASGAVSKSAGKPVATAARPPLDRPPSLVSPSSSAGGAVPSVSSSSRAARLKIFKLFVPLVGATAAPLIERALFEKHGGTNAAYNAHVRELLSSLRLLKEAPSQSALLTDIALGTVSAPQLVAMSTKDLASDDLRQLRQSQEQELIRNLQRPADSATSVHALRKQQEEEASSKQLEAAIHLFESSARTAQQQQRTAGSFGRSSLPPLSSLSSLPPLSAAAPLSLADLPNITDFLHESKKHKQQRKGEEQGAKSTAATAAAASGATGKGSAAAPTTNSKAANSIGAQAAKPAMAKPLGSAIASTKSPASHPSAVSSSSSDDNDGASSSDDELLIVDTPAATKSMASNAKSIGTPARPAVAAAAAASQKRKAPAAATSAAPTAAPAKVPASKAPALHANSKPAASASAISAPSKPVVSLAASSSLSSVAESPVAKRSKIDGDKTHAPMVMDAAAPGASAPMADVLANPLPHPTAAVAPASVLPATDHRDGERKSPSFDHAVVAVEEEELPAEEVAVLHPTDPLHLPTRSEDASAVAAYSGQLAFAFPRRGELFVSLTPLLVKDLFPASVTGASASARAVSEGRLSAWDCNCWSAILPGDLSALHKMRVTEIERYIQFKANLHNQPTRAGNAAPSPSIQAASRLYPISFTMRATEPLLAALARDMTTFHQANKLALALDFESSSVAPARQCVLWLIPPGSLQYLTHHTATELLHWVEQPGPHEWWGILWVKAFAWKAMRKNAEAARRRAQAELDVPSDGEEAAADADMQTEEKSAQGSVSAAAPGSAPEQSPATSNQVLQLIQDPNKIASTASYLNNLLHKISSKPEAAAAASAAISAPAVPAAAATTAASSTSGPSLSSIIASIRNAAKKHIALTSGAGIAPTVPPPAVGASMHGAPVPAPPSPPPPILSAAPLPLHAPQLSYQMTPPAVAPFVQPPPQPMMYAQQPMQQQAIMAYAPQSQPAAPHMWQPQPQPQQQQLAYPYAAPAPQVPQWHSSAPVVAPALQPQLQPPMHLPPPPPPPPPSAVWVSTAPQPSQHVDSIPAGWPSAHFPVEQPTPHNHAPAWTSSSSHLHSTVHPSRAHVFHNATQQQPLQPAFDPRIHHRG